MANNHLFEVNLEQYRNTLKRSGEALASARANLDMKTLSARDAALAAIAAGMPERQVHLALGVSIPTLRKWQGKK